MIGKIVVHGLDKTKLLRLHNWVQGKNKMLMCLWKPVPAYLKDGGRGWGSRCIGPLGAVLNKLILGENDSVLCL